MDENRTAELVEASLDYKFGDRRLLHLALTHRTWIEEQHPGGQAPAHLSQQRLEFLGDALLNYVVGRWLYDTLPDASEGDLTKARTRFTKGAWLRERGEELGVRAFVRSGKGETAQAAANGRLVEDTVEALIGAIALDGGDERAALMIRSWLPEGMRDEAEVDPIVTFSEWFQRVHRDRPPEPEYNVSGSDHQPTWCAEMQVDDIRARGVGAKRQDARRAACRDFLDRLAARSTADQLDRKHTGR